MYCQLIDKKKANNKSNVRAILLTKKRPYFVNKSLKFVPKKRLENL
jgi:hypothetical protein